MKFDNNLRWLSCLCFVTVYRQVVASIIYDNKPLNLIVISMDGFRPDYINQTDTPNLYRLQSFASRGHMLSQFPTKTFPNHQSIATGLFEPYHGLINNQLWDPVIGQDFDISHGTPYWWDQFNLSVPIYIANELYHSDRTSGSVQWPGSEITYGNGTTGSSRSRVTFLQNYQPNIKFDKEIDLALSWLSGVNKSRPAPNCLFIYFSQPDSMSHEYGPFHEKTIAEVRKLDDSIGRLHQGLIDLKQYHRTNLIVLSDHGMITVNAKHNLFLQECNLMFPGLSYKMKGVSPVWSIWPESKPFSASFAKYNLTEGVYQALRECLTTKFSQKIFIYRANEGPARFHYDHNVRILPIYIYALIDYDIFYNETSERHRLGWPVYGNHGYDNREPEMRPLFFALGPNFRSDYDHPTEFENVDLYPLMLYLLQIPVTSYPHNGTFARVRGMLSHELFLSPTDYLYHKAGVKAMQSIIVRFLIGKISSQYLVYIVNVCLFLVIACILIGLAALFGLGMCLVLIIEFSSFKSGKSNRVFLFLQRRSNENNRTSSFANNHQDYTYNRLTDIDWDVVETAGLDIDLKGQLSPVYDQQSRREYLRQTNKLPDSEISLVESENVLFDQFDRRKAKLNNTVQPPLVQLDDQT